MQILKKKQNSHLPIVLISLVISLLIISTYHLVIRANAPHIMTVHLSDIINHRVKSLVQAKLPPEQLKKKMQIFAQQLDTTLKQLAYQHHAVILVSEAVASGAEDVTGEVENKLRSRKAS